jgi:hypothetical protein
MSLKHRSVLVEFNPNIITIATAYYYEIFNFSQMLLQTKSVNNRKTVKIVKSYVYWFVDMLIGLSDVD